jgi:Zn-dependent protease
MQKGFRIGKIAGIQILIDWSWLLIFLLISWNLAIFFSQIHPEWGTGLRWGLAMLAAILFFASVLAHELAHSFVAISQGIPVRSIILFMFGGVSNIQREPASPRSEFLITIVGPLTSLLIGIGLLFLTALLGGIQYVVDQGPGTEMSGVLRNLGPLASILAWLGSVNLILAVFNLVPGFPLDGGRVLRSILWWISGNLRRATHQASLVGQAISWILIVSGVAMLFGFQVPLLGSGLINGLWLVFIGWFLNSASIQSYRRVVIRDILEGIPVAKLMRRNPPVVDKHLSIENLISEYVLGSDDHAFPVLDGERLAGLVTLEDVRKITRDRWSIVNVGEIMTPIDQLVVIKPDADSADALEQLTQRDVRQLPVVSNGVLVGLLRRKDIIKFLSIETEFEE